MLLSPSKNGLTSLNKEVRVFKVRAFLKLSGDVPDHPRDFLGTSEDPAGETFRHFRRAHAKDPPVLKRLRRANSLR